MPDPAGRGQPQPEGLSETSVRSDWRELTEHRQESARQWIALAIVGTLVFIVVAAFAAFWLRGQGTAVDDVVKLVQAVMTPVVGLAGAVTGFYYGERRGRQASADPSD